MARIFKTPFGAQGDTEQVPEAPQGDGSVSLTQGFGYDYEREYEDPAAKDIRREVMNGLFHDVTEAIGDIQLTGVAKWSADAAPYPAGAVVWHDSVAWRSTSGNNSSEPGTGGWRPINAEATETEAGISAIATQAEVDAGTNDTKFVTAKKLKAWATSWVKQATETVAGMLKVATQAQVDAGQDDTTAVTPRKLRWGVSYNAGVNGYVALPSWLGGFIFQWGQYSYSDLPNTENSFEINLPIVYPNQYYIVVATNDTATQLDNIITTRGLNNTRFFAQVYENTVGAYPGLIRYFSVGR